MVAETGGPTVFSTYGTYTAGNGVVMEQVPADAQQKMLEIYRNYIPVSVLCDVGETKCLKRPIHAINSHGYTINLQSQCIKFLLKNGDLIAMIPTAQRCLDGGRCGWFYYIFDAQSSKPATIGRDGFAFHYSPTKIVPEGANRLAFDAKFGGHYQDRFDEACQHKSEQTVAADVNGIACTAWVLVHKNLDYLHCPGLRWNGPKTKCN